ncbi:hypothetical protein BDN70DRAFT_371207 [Pholiota conissans]|uniref:Uncharacterized protein n=1 Tax=Pholiota conissans TaxID=109636 RepID=A0A9P5ZHP3_9AGAR|nr:hypothetical protein BDN70DRAFT_371207 [Pholiota conissans]
MKPPEGKPHSSRLHNAELPSTYRSCWDVSHFGGLLLNQFMICILRRTTSRTTRSYGGLFSTTNLRNEIAVQIEGEFVITDVANFWKSYIPFEPTDDDLESLEDIMSNTEQRLQFKCFEDTYTHDSITEKAYFQPGHG